MSTLHGKDLTAFTYNAQNFKANLLGIQYKVSAQAHDTTTIGDQWIEFTGGLKGGDDVTLNFLYDDTADGCYDYFVDRLGTAATMVITMGARGISVSALVKEVSPQIAVGDMVKHSVVVAQSGAVTFS